MTCKRHGDEASRWQCNNTVFEYFSFVFSYVPALRPLRQQAFLLTFPQTQPSRLAQRLAEVSKYRHIPVLIQEEVHRH